MPGATQDLDWWFSEDTLNGEIRDITDRNIPVVTMGTLATWGNSAVRADMATLKTTAQTSFFGSGKVHLLGVSAGGLCALNFAKNNPTLVQSLSLLIPVIDPQAVYDGNLGGFQASISTAYGGRPANADTPSQNAASFIGIPTKIWYSTSDTITSSSITTTFAAAAGATAVSMGAVGHFWGAPWSGIAAGNFMRENNT